MGGGKRANRVFNGQGMPRRIHLKKTKLLGKPDIRLSKNDANGDGERLRSKEYSGNIPVTGSADFA